METTTFLFLVFALPLSVLLSAGWLADARELVQTTVVATCRSVSLCSFVVVVVV